MNDQIKGMIYGCMLGDSLGIPFEFYHSSPKHEYDGSVLNKDVTINFRWSSVFCPAGAVSDDSEMTLILLKYLLDNGNVYNRDQVLLAYLEWARDAKMIGKNTRALFKGIKTIKGYEARMAKMENKDTMQSNGSLMRASPLILNVKSSDTDVNLTNPNGINRRLNKIYIHVLLMINEGKTRAEIISFLKELQTNYPIIRELLTDIITGVKRNIVEQKRWVGNSFYISLYTYLHFNDIEKGFEYIITQKGSDTDTNACIYGALAGLELGYSKLFERTKDNIECINKYLRDFKPELAWICNA